MCEVSIIIMDYLVYAGLSCHPGSYDSDAPEGRGGGREKVRGESKEAEFFVCNVCSKQRPFHFNSGWNVETTTKTKL